MSVLIRDVVLKIHAELHRNTRLKVRIEMYGIVTQ